MDVEIKTFELPTVRFDSLDENQCFYFPDDSRRRVCMRVYGQSLSNCYVELLNGRVEKCVLDSTPVILLKQTQLAEFEVNRT